MFTHGAPKSSLGTRSNVTVHSRLNLNLEMLVFAEGGKLEYPEKNPLSRDENQQQTQPTYGAKARNRTRATLVGGLRGRQMLNHCAIPAPPNTFQDPFIQSALSHTISTRLYWECVLSVTNPKTIMALKTA